MDANRVFEITGRKALHNETLDTAGEYVALDVVTVTGIENAILTGITIRNMEATADPLPLVRLALDTLPPIDPEVPEDLDETLTVDIYPDRDMVYLDFDPKERRTSVLVRDVGATVLINVVFEYELAL